MKKLIPIVAFLAVAVASLAMAGFAYFAGQEAARIKFEATADDALNRIEGRVDLHLTLLRATHALFAARDGDVSRASFKAFFDSLDVAEAYSGLRGIGYLKSVQTGDEAAAEAEIERNFGVRNAIFPATDMVTRSPLVLFEPLEPGNIRNMGFDMYTDPARRVAIDTAAASGQPSATGLLQLGQATASQQVFPGFLVFQRVDVKSPADSGDPKTAGFLYAAFRGQDLFESALGRAPLLPIAVEVYDGTPAQGSLLFRSQAPPTNAYGNLRAERQLVVAGRSWTLVQRPTEAFAPPASRAIPLMLGLFGLLLAGAVAVVARYQHRAYEAASLLQRQAETSLIEKDLMLQEMKHRIKNSIARVLAMARQTAAHATDLKEFSASFASRLQAMAASQDMLTRSRWQKADLRQLLEIELKQVFGKELPPDMLSGGEVLLDERATQALGLTFHELATNALKYGKVGEGMEGLKVNWRIETSQSQRTLAFNWREAGNGVTPPQKTGFGTKLIDMNITRELGGTIARDYRDDGLSIAIKIPMTLA